MLIRRNFKRIIRFLLSHYNDIFTSYFWGTINRVTKERFVYFNRISDSEFLSNLKQLGYRPWNLHIELTNVCNADCIFCAYRFQRRNKLIMDKNTYSKAISDYCRMGGGELRLESCIGDPLMDEDFISRVREARSHLEILKITTFTNGINLDQISIDEILSSGINEINISTGPWSKNLYRSIYRVDGYDKMRQNVKDLLIENERKGRPVKIKILFRSNLPMRSTIALPDYNDIKNIPHEVEFNIDFDSWLGTIKQEYLLNGMHLKNFYGLEKEPCYLLYDGPIVFADGNVGLCGCRDFNADSELIIGNILDSTLLELWQSEKTFRLRQRFRDGDFPDICRNCTAYANLDFYRTRKGTLRAQFISSRLKKV